MICNAVIGRLQKIADPYQSPFFCSRKGEANTTAEKNVGKIIHNCGLAVPSAKAIFPFRAQMFPFAVHGKNFANAAEFCRSGRRI